MKTYLTKKHYGLFAMTNELDERVEELVKENAKLTERLEDANNEIARMGMVSKRHVKDVEFLRLLSKQNEWALVTACH
jgi:predicted nuclease with TOPRIM domain